MNLGAGYANSWAGPTMIDSRLKICQQKGISDKNRTKRTRLAQSLASPEAKGRDERHWHSDDHDCFVSSLEFASSHSCEVTN
jgi:hypothetical protein